MEREPKSDSTVLQDVAVMAEKTMADFLEAMRLREELSLRIGRRTSQIIRVGAVSVTLLSVAIVYLTASLNRDMGDMRIQMEKISGYMARMEQHFVTVSANTGSMQQSVMQMSENIGSMPEMSRSVVTMGSDITALKDEVALIGQDVGMMSGGVDSMTRQMGVMNGNMNNMNYSVYRMARPMSLIPLP